MIRLRAAILCTLLAASLTACMETVTDPGKLKQTPTNDLCEMYYFANHPSTYTTGTPWPGKLAAIKTELNRRNALTSDEWSLIDANRLQQGMSECALKAVWGNPIHINHAVTAAGESTQYVYGLSRTVNLLNGQVKSVQY